MFLEKLLGLVKSKTKHFTHLTPRQFTCPVAFESEHFQGTLIPLHSIKTQLRSDRIRHVNGKQHPRTITESAATNKPSHPQMAFRRMHYCAGEGEAAALLA